MKLYVGTYKKYNEGSLEGAWLDLEDYNDADEFRKACYELHKDEDDPELMFQDSDIDYDWEDGLYSECNVPEEWWEIKDELERLHVDDEIFSAYCDEISGTVSADEVHRCQDAYIGEYEDGETYAREYYEDSYKTVSDLGLWDYIDWERVWSDMEDNGMRLINNHLFDTTR